MLIPAYRDMDPYDLPEEFSHLQAQDMSKLGFMQDLIRGIKKIIEADAPKQTVKETVIVGANNAATTPLLERVFLFLDDFNDKLALSREFRVCFTHIFDESVDELIHESRFLLKESVSVSNCASENTPDDVSGFSVRREL